MHPFIACAIVYSRRDKERKGGIAGRYNLRATNHIHEGKPKMEEKRLTIAEAQQAVDAWIRAHGGYWEPLAQLARLTEEVGEVAREINHHYGPKRKKPSEAERALADELGDLLYIVIATANSVGVDLDAALRASLAKYTERDANRYGQQSREHE
jgi:NTP pyrophosphatase (non-canonical NTP hydrolase)